MAEKNYLREEQERILESLSQVLPGSSQIISTNAEDLEKVLNEGKQIENGGNSAGETSLSLRKKKKKKNCCPFTKAASKKRGRSRKNVAKESKSITEENDSGFGTWSEIAKSVTPATQQSDSEDSVTSMESVSLLQTASSIPMEVDDGVNLAWNVKVFPPIPDDDDDDEEEMLAKTTADKSIQTIQEPFPVGDDTIIRSVNFITSVIRLRQIFTSQATVTTKNFEKILRRLPESPNAAAEASTEEGDQTPGSGGVQIKRRRMSGEETISGDRVYYAMRQTNVDEVTEKSVDSILAWLREETESNWRNVFYCWIGSPTAAAVDVLNEAVDSDVVGIRRKVSDFLVSILNEIQGERDEEFKVAFLSNFCKSFLLQFDLIIHIEEKLSAVVQQYERDQIKSAKTGYFTLRLLENLFRSFLTGLTNRGAGIFRIGEAIADRGVLDLWKRNWMRGEIAPEDGCELRRKYERSIRKWCQRIDQFVEFSARECPVLSAIAQRCSSLARETLTHILKI